MNKKDYRKNINVEIEKALITDFDYPNEKDVRRESYMKKKRK